MARRPSSGDGQRAIISTSPARVARKAAPAMVRRISGKGWQAARCSAMIDRGAAAIGDPPRSSSQE